MPECAAFPEVIPVSSAVEFSAALDAAKLRGMNEQFRNRLRQVARENSWGTRVCAVVEYLNRPRSAEHRVIDPSTREQVTACADTEPPRPDRS
jgi:hypothetical protein